jgi:hypothetical protein
MIMAEASATIGEIERELSTALSRDDKPLAVSAINSILHKLGSKPEVKPRRITLLKRKLELVQALKI